MGQVVAKKTIVVHLSGCLGFFESSQQWKTKTLKLGYVLVQAIEMKLF